MKRTFCALLVAGLMAVAGTASALPPVTLDPAGCALAATLNSQHIAVCSGAMLDLGDPELVDIESVAGPMDGDGIPDLWQLDLLASAICADAGLHAQLEFNQAAFTAFIAGFNAFKAQAQVVIPQCTAVGTQLTALGPPLNALGPFLTGTTNSMDYKLTYFATYLTVLPMYTDWFATTAGLSTEMQATFTGMWDDFFGDVPGYATLLVNPGCNPGDPFHTCGLAQLLGVAAGMLPAGPLATACATLSGGLTTLAGLIAVLDVGLPDFEVYGVAKTALEPFSGAGDYDGNGDTNKVVAACSDGPAEFVAAASGEYFPYPCNSNMPVAGIFGLALLAGACVMGGAASIRRK